MAREVTHEENGPAKLDESDMGDDGMIYVCLSVWPLGLEAAL